jgi:hypothetical protein
MFVIVAERPAATLARRRDDRPRNRIAQRMTNAVTKGHPSKDSLVVRFRRRAIGVVQDDRSISMRFAVDYLLLQADMRTETSDVLVEPTAEGGKSGAR